MFDLIEARLNRAALAKLANAVAVIDGADVPVIFDSQYKRGMVGVVGMGAQAPQMVMRDSDASGSWLSSPFTIRQAGKPDSQWVVSEVDPDESPDGLTTLMLRKA